jgi:predicted nucleic-acid-binding Zn-ribbon protein
MSCRFPRLVGKAFPCGLWWAISVELPLLQAVALVEAVGQRATASFARPASNAGLWKHSLFYHVVDDNCESVTAKGRICMRVKTTIPVARIRTEPRPDGEVLLTVSEGTELELLERGKRYSRVQFDDGFRRVEGWAANTLLDLPEGAPSLAVAGSSGPVCPHCGQQEWKQLPMRTTSSMFSRVYLGSVFDGYYLQARVCLGCGYVDLHLDSQALHRLTQSE